MCVMVANESDGILYLRQDRRSPLVEYVTLRNEAADKSPGNLTSDKPGRSFDSHGQGRHHMQGPRSAKQQAALRFAARLVSELEDGKRRGDIGDYALIAAPGMLGLLRKEISRSFVGEPVFAADKDIAHQSKTAAERLLLEAW
ncbi:MAG: host attachment protein [Pseudomonadota bacterium]